MAWQPSPTLRGTLVAAAFALATLAIIRGLRTHDSGPLLTGIAALVTMFAWSTARLHKARGTPPGKIHRPAYDRAAMRAGTRQLMQLMFAALVLTWLAVLAALAVLLLQLAPGMARLAGGLDRTALDLLTLLAAIGLALACQMRWRKTILRLAAGPAHDMFSATRR